MCERWFLPLAKRLNHQALFIKNFRGLCVSKEPACCGVYEALIFCLLLDQAKSRAKCYKYFFTKYTMRYFLFFMCLSQFVLAQVTIKGKVFDKTTGGFLIHAEGYAEVAEDYLSHFSIQFLQETGKNHSNWQSRGCQLVPIIIGRKTKS